MDEDGSPTVYAARYASKPRRIVPERHLIQLSDPTTAQVTAPGGERVLLWTLRARRKLDRDGVRPSIDCPDSRSTKPDRRAHCQGENRSVLVRIRQCNDHRAQLALSGLF